MNLALDKLGSCILLLFSPLLGFLIHELFEFGFQEVQSSFSIIDFIFFHFFKKLLHLVLPGLLIHHVLHVLLQHLLLSFLLLFVFLFYQKQLLFSFKVVFMQIFWCEKINRRRLFNFFCLNLHVPLCFIDRVFGYLDFY